MSGDLVVILGMHRSGTSMLANVLVDAGLHPGFNLLPATGENPKGFWECREIVDLNEEILESVDSAWFDPLWIRLDLLERARLEEFRERAVEALKREFPGSERSVIKDPRLCRLMPFWRPIFDAHFSSVTYLHLIRDPGEVCASLAKRNGFSNSLGALLWSVHLFEVLRLAEEVPMLTLLHGDLFSDREGSLRKLGTFLDLPDEEIERGLRAVDASLRHHHATEGGVPGSSLGGFAEMLWERVAAADGGTDTVGLRGLKESLDGILESIPADLKISYGKYQMQAAMNRAQSECLQRSRTRAERWKVQSEKERARAEKWKAEAEELSRIKTSRYWRLTSLFRKLFPVNGRD